MPEPFVRSRIRRIGSCVALLIAVASSGPPLRAQTTVLASVASDGTKKSGESMYVSMSPDGRYVAFASTSNNLDPLDPQNTLDVYWRDLEAGTTTVVSKSSGGVLGDASSTHPAISRDGKFVAYASNATNLVAGDTNGNRDVFLFEVATGTTTRVSIDGAGNEGDGISEDPAISADGTKIAFTSAATNLVAGDVNARNDVFVRDTSTGTTVRVSVDSSGLEANSNSSVPAISADGNLVVFLSVANNLVPADTNHRRDVFVHDCTTGMTTRVNLGAGGVEADSESFQPNISGDGRVVAFRSIAANLVPGDVNQKFDAFAVDVATGALERVSVASDGSEGDRDTMERPALSYDGRFVVFTSASTNLVDDPALLPYEVYARDRTLGMTTWLSRGDQNQDGTGGQCFDVATCDDGSRVAFTSSSSGLVPIDSDAKDDVFVRERNVSPASASSYGTGTAGELGVPSLDASAPPFLDSDFDLIVGTSTSSYTIGILVLGVAPQSLPVRGGTLLVVPLMLLPIALSPGSTSFAQSLPPDELLAGATVYLQVLELDAAAPRGVSFTPGLALTPGF